MAGAVQPITKNHKQERKAMKTHRTATVFALTIVGALATAAKVHAAEISTNVASTCTVDESDLSRAQMNYARLMFAVGQTGTIKARCNITNPRDNGDNPGWDRLQIT